jgi:iron complex outermembrane recepter protein
VQTIEFVATPVSACSRRVRRVFLQSTAAVVLANVLAPVGAEAQTALPDINVIATTPLSGTRSPQRIVSPPAPTRPARATGAEPTTTPGRATGTRTTAARTAPASAPSVPAEPVSEPLPPIQGPAASGEISRDKVPSNTEVLTSEDFSHDKSTSFLDSIGQYLPGVFIGDQSGNQFQRDVNYRGFVASPVQGTPQGLAVYQNGVRINEA